MKNIISNLNKAFDHRTRLGIMSVLMVNDWMDFNGFKEMLDDIKDGTLASHLKALEKEKYIEVRKQFIGRKPNTAYRASEAGKQAFNDHLNALEAILKMVE